MKNLFFVLVCVVWMNTIPAHAASKIVEQSAPGTLNTLIPASERDSLTELTISGNIDVRDFGFMRDSLPVLSIVDISKVVIEAHFGSNGFFQTPQLHAKNEIPMISFLKSPEIPNKTLTRIVLPDSLTSIANFAFAYCEALTEVYISSQITQIGNQSFWNSSVQIHLEENHPFYTTDNGVLISKQYKTLMFCPVGFSGDYVIPQGIDSIARGAFNNSKLVNVEIPSSVSFIGSQAFGYCDDLTGIKLHTRPEFFNIEGDPFYGDTLTNCVLYVPYQTATLYKSKTPWKYFGNIIASDSGVYVNQSAMTLSCGMDSTSIIIHSTVDWQVQTDQTWLQLNKSSGSAGTDTVLVYHDANIGKERKGRISFTTDQYQPQIVQVIQNGAPVLIQLQAGGLSDSIPAVDRNSIKSLVLQGTMDARDFKFIRDSLLQLNVLDMKNVQIVAYSGPDGTRENLSVYEQDVIPPYGLFSGLIGPSHKLQKVYLPENTKAVGDAAFVYCSLLDSVYFGQKLETIGLSGFQGCYNLKSIDLPVTLKRLKSYAFMSCWNIKKVVVHNNVPINLNADFSVFSDLDLYKCILQVPFGSGALYAKTSYWREFRNIKEDPYGFAMDTADVKITAKGAIYATVKVKTSEKWTATADQPWVKLLTSGAVGTDSIRISADENLTYKSRSAYITVTTEAFGSFRFKLIQGDDPKVIELVAGELTNLLSVSEKEALKGLIITGTMDSRDFKTIRDNMSNLEYLDISAVKILAFNGNNATALVNQADALPDNAFCNPFSTTVYSKLERLFLPNNTRILGSSSLRKCNKLSQFDMPDSVKIISDDAFAECMMLDSLQLPEALDSIGTTAFDGNFEIKFSAFPSGLKGIGKYAFHGIKSLTTIYLSKSLKTLGMGAFNNCSSIISVTAEAETPIDLSKRPYMFDGIDFSQCVLHIPFMSKKAYAEADQWKNFVLIQESPNGLVLGTDSVLLLDGKLKGEAIIYSNGNWQVHSTSSWLTFAPENGNRDTVIAVIAEINNTTNLRKAIVVVEIPGIKSLKFLVIQPGMTKTIENTTGTLHCQLNLDEQQYNSGLVIKGQMDARDFRFLRDSMPNLKELDLAEVKILAYSGSDGTEMNKSVYYPASTIPSFAFSKPDAVEPNQTLQKLILPVDYSAIGQSAFKNCSRILPELILPKNLTEIGDYAFSGCDSLKFLFIPEKTTRIGSCAFNSRQLQTIITTMAYPPAYGSGIFENVNKQSCNLFVPKATKKNYLLYSQWNSFVNLREDLLDLSVNDTLRIQSEEMKQVELKTEQKWTVTTDKSWIQVTPEVNATGAILHITTEANNADSIRTGYVTVTLMGILKYGFYVQQSGKPWTVNITAGGLSTALQPEELSRITSLTITGSVDARDFKTLRDQMPMLSYLDMSETSVMGYSGTEGVLTGQNTYQPGVLPDYAFYVPYSGKGMKQLNTIKLPKDITYIGKAAFGYASVLTVVEMPETVSLLGEYVFMWCRNLTDIQLSSKITAIPGYAFFACEKLKTMVLPEGISFIGYQSFFCCYGLQSINIPQTVQTIKEDAFFYCKSLESFTFPESTTIIPDGILEGCESLKSVYMPDHITQIDGYAFYGCSTVKEFKMPSKLTKIGTRSFGKCSGLTNIDIPVGVTSIGYGAFEFCTGLQTIHAYPVKAVDLSAHSYALVFNSVNKSKCILYVPSEAKYSYMTSDEWFTFSKIIGMTTDVEGEVNAAIKLFPNPVKDQFRLDGLSEPTSVSVLDMQGKVLIFRTMYQDEMIDVSDLPKGTYLIRIQLSTGIKILRMMKE